MKAQGPLAAGETRVAVFSTRDRYARKPSVRAYTLWYDASWDGCCLHHMPTTDGTEAKRQAIAEHRAQCMGTA